LRFIAIVAQVVQVGIQAHEVIQLHAALDAPQDGRALVLVEVVSRAGVDLRQDALQGFQVLIAELARVVGEMRIVPAILCQLFRQLRGR
jgi:hypothetical protein